MANCSCLRVLCHCNMIVTDVLVIQTPNCNIIYDTIIVYCALSRKFSSDLEQFPVQTLDILAIVMFGITNIVSIFVGEVHPHQL